jgi:hypothetical protein
VRWVWSSLWSFRVSSAQLFPGPVASDTTTCLAGPGTRRSPEDYSGPWRRPRCNGDCPRPTP